ncbi:MAG: hypothetical protein LC792_27775, partial [Actinobacteria bacterium]|nr:hypothetical protein [Actinomycetota bacterium]
GRQPYRFGMSQSLTMNLPAHEWLELLLSYLWEQRGTDLHLTAGSAPLVRVGGQLLAVPSQPVLKPADTTAMAAELLDETDRATFPAGVSLPTLLDACVDLWTARRIAARAVARLPEVPEWNEDGLRMELVR